MFPELNELLNNIKTQLLDNQIFIGLITSGILFSLSYSLRGIPKSLYILFLRSFTINIQIDNRNKSYEYFNKWLFSKINNAHNIIINGDLVKKEENIHTPRYDRLRSDNNKNNIITPGFDTFWFIWRRHFIIFNRIRTTEGIMEIPLDTLNIRILFHNKNTMKNIINEITEFLKEDKIYIYMWYWDRWSTLSDINKRTLNSIYIPEEQKNFILNDIKNFIENKEWYKEKHIPYNRGYLFYGDPGCGKTSLIKVIASELNYDIYYLNLSSFSIDNTFIECFNSIPKNTLLVIEDFDTIYNNINSNRDNSNLNPKPEESKGMSMSVFLNTIDGLLSTEGKIIFYTTNYKDKIDKAILRPGRIDVIEEIKPLSFKYIKKMSDDFFDIDCDLNFLSNDISIPGSKLQNYLIQNKDSINNFYKVLKEQYCDKNNE